MGSLADGGRFRVDPCKPASRHRLLTLLILAVVSWAGMALHVPTTAAQTPGVSYIYDDLGRLIAVVDSTGAAAVYAYDAVGNLLSITRQGPGVVSILDFTPKQGPIGTAVTISGTGFSATASQNTVAFNGSPATVTSATATQLVTTVPAGATTGPIAVTTPNGSATSSKSFTVTAPGAPTITGFTPTIGTPGTAVTITGTNFEPTPPANTVLFNQLRRAAVESATATTLGAKVPAQVGSGRLTVATPAGKAVSTADFFIPPSSYTAAQVEVTGRMVIGETRSFTLSASSKIALMIFDGAAGQRISVSGSSTSPIGGLDLYDPYGTVIDGGAAFGGGVAFIDTKVLPLTATYTLLASSPGTVTLTLYEVPPDITATITPGGPSVTVTPTTPGQNARLTFSGTAGQRVSLLLSTSTPATDITLVNPDGTTLVGPVTMMPGDTTPDFIDATTLPQTGTYTILVDPRSYYTNSLTLTLYDVPPDVTGTLTLGTPFTVSITTPGQNARLTFSGTAGQRVSLALSSTTIRITNVTVTNPDGTTLVTNSRGTGEALAFDPPATLPQTGTYTVLIDPRGPETGSRTVTLYDVPPDVSGTIAIGGPSVTVTITTPGQNARLTFDGTAGQLLRLTISNVTMSPGGGAWVSILNPDGTTLVAQQSISVLVIDLPTLPQTGTYTIFLDPIEVSTGSMMLTLQVR